jgi:ribosomal peptide maturation radical SAM protein 1
MPKVIRVSVPPSLCGVDALLVVPPFGALNVPAFGVHALQAYACRAGFEVGVLYANFSFASMMGIQTYKAFYSQLQLPRLAGERLFAPSVYSMPTGDGWHDRPELSMFLPDIPPEQLAALGDINSKPFPLTSRELQRLEALVPPWVDAMAKAIAQLGVAVVGCTSSFEQTNASLALFRRIRHYETQITTIIGGANCAGEMAEGIASLDPGGAWLDHIFSGESEVAFVEFLQGLRGEGASFDRIIHGQPCQDLDALPLPEFDEYFDQLDRYFPDERASLGSIGILYETSRGCWWGQRSRCAFCGLNEDRIRYRYKSADHVIKDLQKLERAYPVDRVVLTDNILPNQYLRSLVPRIARSGMSLTIASCIKANLSLHDVLALKEAGFSLLVGIESLSTDLLSLMHKGLLARQNVALLRYGGASGVHLQWYLMWGFPGDTLEMYAQMLSLLPLLRHLQPPAKMTHLFISRFSSYFENPEAYGIRDLKPLPCYVAAFPSNANLYRIAASFAARYESGAHQNLQVIAEIAQEVTSWQQSWQRGRRPPLLHVMDLADQYVLMDTRALPDTRTSQVLTPAQAAAALVAQPYEETEEIVWALENKVGVQLDRWYVPLATARPKVLQAFEEQFRGHAR